MEKLGNFKYPELKDKDLEKLPTLGPFELENGAIYLGQWKQGSRHGKGKQIWGDGSVYEGLWKNGMANGYGRLIHADGDVYEGQWEDDRAHGEGKKIYRLSKFTHKFSFYKEIFSKYFILVYEILFKNMLCLLIFRHLYSSGWSKL